MQKLISTTKPLKKAVLTAMRKWLRDLDRAIVKHGRGAILNLYEYNENTIVFEWDNFSVSEDMATDYELFTNRANNILYEK